MFAINRAATTVARRAPRAWAAATPQMRWFSDEAEEPVERDQLHYDVVCVGGGPAGLSAAIRIKQLALEREQELSVCVVEKGGELGAHILSGNVFETRGLDELFPDWREMGEEGPPIETEVGAWDGAILVRPCNPVCRARRDRRRDRTCALASSLRGHGATGRRCRVGGEGAPRGHFPDTAPPRTPASTPLRPISAGEGGRLPLSLRDAVPPDPQLRPAAAAPQR